jgi:hypothetical protein
MGKLKSEQSIYKQIVEWAHAGNSRINAVKVGLPETQCCLLFMQVSDGQGPS